MTDLEIRRIPFEFDENTPFQWNPTNPHFGMLGTMVSFVAPAFEKYIVRVVRDAQKVITDPAVAEEADAFLRQEAQHARAHRHHTSALIEQYPGLQEAIDVPDASYDRLYEEESLDFHLAYVANIEATFGPLFRTWLGNRDSLFDNGDPAVASLLMWHFVEEVEHRSSAFTIFNAVVPNRLTRLRHLPRVKDHMREVVTGIVEVFDRAVPFEDRLVDASSIVQSRSLLDRIRTTPPADDRYPGAFDAVPKREMLHMAFRITLSQWPWVDPEKEEVSPIADDWRADYSAGHDMLRWSAA